MNIARAARLLPLALFVPLLPLAASSTETVPVIEAPVGPLRQRCTAPADVGAPTCGASTGDLGTVARGVHLPGSNGENLWFPPRYRDDGMKGRVWTDLPTVPAKIDRERLLRF